jgi:hypothetical protein
VSLDGCSLDHATLVKLAMPSSYDRWNCSGAGHPRAEPLPGGFPSLSKGLCAAFHVTDCLQVLSLVGGAPSHLHVFDPGGTFLFAAEAPPAHAAAAAAGSAAAASSVAVSASAPPPVARRYALGSAKSGPGLVARFPDQFAPFAAYLAAAGSSSSSSGGSRGVSTVLRLPLRVRGSAVSPCAPDAASASAALVGLEPTLRACLVVAKSLGAVYVDHWPPNQAPAATAATTNSGSGSGGSGGSSGGALPCARLVFSVALRVSPLAHFFPRSGDAKGSGGAGSGGGGAGGHAFREPDDARARRRALLEDREAWARRGLLSVFTKFVPPKDLYAVDVAVTRRERVGVATADRGDSGWTFVFF